MAGYKAINFQTEGKLDLGGPVTTSFLKCITPLSGTPHSALQAGVGGG
jgi:hypothetical protein